MSLTLTTIVHLLHTVLQRRSAGIAPNCAAQPAHLTRRTAPSSMSPTQMPYSARTRRPHGTGKPTSIFILCFGARRSTLPMGVCVTIGFEDALAVAHRLSQAFLWTEGLQHTRHLPDTLGPRTAFVSDPTRNHPPPHSRETCGVGATEDSHPDCERCPPLWLWANIAWPACRSPPRLHVST